MPHPLEQTREIRPAPRRGFQSVFLAIFLGGALYLGAIFALSPDPVIPHHKDHDKPKNESAHEQSKESH